jgi:hypothetical protein
VQPFWPSPFLLERFGQNVPIVGEIQPRHFLFSASGVFGGQTTPLRTRTAPRKPVKIAGRHENL